MGLVLAKLWSFFGNEGEFYSIKKNTLGLELLKSGLCMSLNLVSCEKKKDVASFNEVFGRFTCRKVLYVWPHYIVLYVMM